MTAKKKFFVVLTALLATVAIVAISVFTTVALLSSSAAVSNVFTIGDVGITMNERKVNLDGTWADDGATRVGTNTYKLVPNTKYNKDPKITVKAGSESSYLFVLVKNDLKDIEIVSDDADKMTIAEQLIANGWSEYTTAATGKVYVYKGYTDDVMNEKAAAVGSANAEEYKLFDYFYISPSANVSAYGAAKVTLTAVAIQTSGFGEDIGSTAALNAAWTEVKNIYPYIHTGQN